MEIIYIPTDKLKPYKGNPRRNDDAVDAVASSIAEFGFKVPIVVDSNNEIIAGHTRLKAAKKLGMKEIPAIVADDLTEEQIKAFRLADNKVSELAQWDISKLDQELDEILDIDMSEFGFTIPGDSFELLDQYGFGVEVPATEEFSVTFVFPKSEEEPIRKYIKEKGKKELAEMILKKCKEVQNVG